MVCRLTLSFLKHQFPKILEHIYFHNIVLFKTWICCCDGVGIYICNANIIQGLQMPMIVLDYDLCYIFR